MRRINPLLLILTLLTVACQPKVDRFTLNGQVAQADGSTLYLDHIALDKIEVIDSVKLDAEGKFSFSPAAPVGSFDFYRLRLNGRVINLVVDSTETVTVDASRPSFQTTYTVSGSENCATLKRMVAHQREFLQDLRQVSSEYENPSRSIAYQQRILEMVDVFKSELMNEYIFPDPSSPCAYYALFMSIGGQMIFNPQSNRQDARCFAAVATQMDMLYPNAVRTEHIHNVALKGMSKTSTQKGDDELDEQTANYVKSLVEVTGLIEIDLPDYQGVSHKLSDLKGDVVLLDFTAFKTDYSPNYNLLLRDLYNKYAQKGFNIYQVSVDSDESFWMNSAANLPWVCVRDEASVYSTYLRSYNVQQIPAVFLIDREGNIVDRPETTDELDEKVAKLLQ